MIVSATGWLLCESNSDEHFRDPHALAFHEKLPFAAPATAGWAVNTGWTAGGLLLLDLDVQPSRLIGRAHLAGFHVDRARDRAVTSGDTNRRND